MTDAEKLAANMIADVPSFAVQTTIGGEHAVAMYETDVLAALARAMGPDDLVEQAGKVLAKLQSQIGDDVQDVYLPEALHKLSADTITALLARIASQEARVKELEAEREGALHFLDVAVDKSPEPLKKLGKHLAELLDEDDWPTAERFLNGTATAFAAEREKVAKLRHAIAVAVYQADDNGEVTEAAMKGLNDVLRATAITEAGQ